MGGPLVNPDAGDEDTGHFGGNWISSWSIYSQGAYQGIALTNIAFTQVDALMESMGLNEEMDDPITNIDMVEQALSDDDPALIVFSYDTNNEKTELEAALTEVHQRYGDKVEAAQVKNWGDFDNLTSYYTGQKVAEGSFDKIILILHGYKGELGFLSKGTKPPSYFTDKINKYYKAKSIAGKELVVWACEQSQSSWVSAMGDDSIKVSAGEKSIINKLYGSPETSTEWSWVSDEFGHWGYDKDLTAPGWYGGRSARNVLYFYYLKRWFGY